MDPGQDLLLAALSESGICPNDFGFFDVDPQDVAQPSTTQQVSWSLFEWKIIVFLMLSKLYVNVLIFAPLPVYLHQCPGGWYGDRVDGCFSK